MKKGLFLLLLCILCMGMLMACGDNSDDSSSEKEVLTVGDITVQVPDDYPVAIDENGNAEYSTDSFILGIYVDTDETAPYYEYYDPPATNVEELYDCFVNRNPDVIDKKEIKIDGQKGILLMYGETGQDVELLYKGKLYSVTVWNEGGVTEKDLKAFDQLVESIALK